MEINDLEWLGFNEIHLNLLFDYTKKINQAGIFEWDTNEDANYVDSLKCENTHSFIEREKFSCDVMKKDSNNKHTISSEIVKYCYSEIAQESFIFLRFWLMFLSNLMWKNGLMKHVVAKEKIC